MRFGPALAASLLALALAGCAATEQSTKVTHSGFLADYSLLSPGEEDDAAFRYWDHDIDWSAYDKILLDPVTLWGAPATEEMPNEDLQRLANNLYGLMYQELSKDYTMVSEPQYGTLRIQFALTGAERSNPALDVVSTVVPTAFVLSSAAQFVTGEPSFGGDAMVEALAKDRGDSIAIGRSYPATIESVADWAAGLKNRGVTLARLSSLAGLPTAQQAQRQTEEE